MIVWSSAGLWAIAISVGVALGISGGIIAGSASGLGGTAVSEPELTSLTDEPSVPEEPPAGSSPYVTPQEEGQVGQFSSRFDDEVQRQSPGDVTSEDGQGSAAVLALPPNILTGQSSSVQWSREASSVVRIASKVADVNRDGVVDEEDLLIVARAIREERTSTVTV